jgi:hypothetical protein
MKSKTIIYIISFLSQTFLFSSCSNQTYKVLERDGNCPVIMEARTWGGITRDISGFELRITNTGENKLSNCFIVFDHKYKHSLNGLYSTDKGLLKDSTLQQHAVLTFQFSGDESNMIYFDIKDDKYVPSEITLECKECSSTWKLK